MLETGDVDDDYFTPVPSTSLFNIFRNQVTNHDDNSSLKYTPPKPVTAKPKPDEKTSDCIFACAIFGYQWFNNVYTSKGKLGFAVMKITKTASTEILLYDSNKSTLSCTTIHPELEVKLKGDTYISFYDNSQKYWSIYGSFKEIQKIAEVLQSLNVIVLNSPEAEDGPPAPQPEENLKNTTMDNVEVKESDTDSFVNRKTKASILNRMANMGHSILPPQTIMKDRTSDSSDTNETFDHHKLPRHKPSRSVVKRTQDKFTMEAPKSSSISDTEIVTCLSLTNKELSPLPSTNIISTINHSNEVNLLMSEQRINNSELRMNMGRLADKVDLILDKVVDIKEGQNSSTNSFHNEILQKLLKEYENKISSYEELIKSKGFGADVNMIIANKRPEYVDYKEKDVEITKLMDQVLTLERINGEKDSKINILNTQLIESQNKLLQEHNTSSIVKDKLSQQIEELKQDLSNKNNELLTYQKESEPLRENSASHLPDIELRLKSIMNNTFQSLSANFDNKQMYSGANIKKTVASVIKNVTLDVIKDT